MWLISSIHDHSDTSDFSRLLPSSAPKAMKFILRFFDSIQFVGAIVEYYPFTLWIHSICSGYWLALQTPTEWSGLEGNKLALPMQNSGTRGVHLQDGRTQGQNFAQNGSQKPFCNGPEAPDLVTKISTGINHIS